VSEEKFMNGITRQKIPASRSIQPENLIKAVTRLDQLSHQQIYKHTYALINIGRQQQKKWKM